MNLFTSPSQDSPNASATLSRSKSGLTLTRSKSMGKINGQVHLGRDSVASMGRAMSGQLSKDAKAKISRLNTHTFHGVAPPDKRVEQFYDLGAEIGKGAFGIVRECIDIETNTKLCCKSIPKASLTDEMFADIQMEAEIMMHLRGHPNVVEIMGLFQDETHIHIVQELCLGGDLYGKLTKNPVPPTEKEIAAIMRQALTVLQHCHAMGVIYRDCKPDNFLLSSKGPDAVLKATDFGISKFLKHGDKLAEFCGTPQYMAPEIFDLSYGFPADTWAAGVTMYWLFCQEFPFKGKNKMDLGRKIATAEPEMTSTMWDNITPDAKDLIKRMLEKDPNKRCTPTGALNHKWFKKMAGVKTDSKPLAPVVLQRMRTFARMPAFKQEVLRHIARTLDAAYLVGVRPMFMEMNKNNSQGIDITELTRGLEAHGVKVDAAEVKNIMYKVDGDLNGEIDFHEFASALLTCGILTRKDLLQEAFDHYDTDKDGNINRYELEAVLKSHNLPEARIAKIIADIDNCGMDGRVDFVAFRNLMLETKANSDVDEFWATRRTYTRVPMAPIARPQYVVFGNSYKPQNSTARFGSGGMTRSASQPLTALSGAGLSGATPDSSVKSPSGARTWTHKDSSYWGNSTGGASKDNSMKGANHYARSVAGKSPGGSSPRVTITGSSSEQLTLSNTPSSEKEDLSDRVLHKVASVFKSFLRSRTSEPKSP